MNAAATPYDRTVVTLSRVLSEHSSTRSSGFHGRAEVKRGLAGLRIAVWGVVGHVFAISAVRVLVSSGTSDGGLLVQGLGHDQDGAGGGRDRGPAALPVRPAPGVRLPGPVGEDRPRRARGARPRRRTSGSPRRRPRTAPRAARRSRPRRGRPPGRRRRARPRCTGRPAGAAAAGCPPCGTGAAATRPRSGTGSASGPSGRRPAARPESRGTLIPGRPPAGPWRCRCRWSVPGAASAVMPSAYRTPGTRAGKSRQRAAACWKYIRFSPS